MGIMAMTPMSPTQASNFFSIHQSMIVTAVTNNTYQCVQVKGSVFFLIRGIERSLSQRYPMWRYDQMATTDTVATGSEMANHCNHERGGSMAARPIKFWGEEMGEA